MSDTGALWDGDSAADAGLSATKRPIAKLAGELIAPLHPPRPERNVTVLAVGKLGPKFRRVDYLTSEPLATGAHILAAQSGWSIAWQAIVSASGTWVQTEFSHRLTGG